MQPLQAFLLGLGVTVILAVAVVWYLKSYLRAILVDLCGTEDRADFWMAFTNVTLILIPMIFAMESYPAPSDGSAVAFQFVGQLKWALIGLTAAVVGVGAVLKSFIPNGRSQTPPRLPGPSA